MKCQSKSTQSTTARRLANNRVTRVNNNFVLKVKTMDFSNIKPQKYKKINYRLLELITESYPKTNIKHESIYVLNEFMLHIYYQIASEMIILSAGCTNKTQKRSQITFQMVVNVSTIRKQVVTIERQSVHLKKMLKQGTLTGVRFLAPSPFPIDATLMMSY